MFEKFTSANAGDFRQRYEGTYGFYIDPAKKLRVLTRVIRVSDDLVEFIDAKGVGYSLKADVKSDKGFEFLPPKSQYYNTQKGAVLCTRVAARQFQRGVSERNMTLALLKGKHHYPLSVDFNNLSEAYGIIQMDNTAMVANTLSKEHPSAALSSHFAIEATGGLFLLSTKIGQWRKLSKMVAVRLQNKELLKTEVSEAFLRSGVEVKVL